MFLKIYLETKGSEMVVGALIGKYEDIHLLTFS